MSSKQDDSDLHPKHVFWDAELAGQLQYVSIQVDAENITHSIAAIKSSLHRFGFVLLGGLGSSGDQAEISNRLVYLSNQLGRIVPQSPRGELIEDIRDFTDVDEYDERGYRSPGRLSPHSDPPTIILLHCLKTARFGGESEIVNVGSIYSAMNQKDPELASVLFEGFPHWEVEGSRGRLKAGPAKGERAIFARYGDLVSCVLYRPFTERAAEHLGVPLTNEQVAALDLFESCANDSKLAVKFTLQPGQTLLLHNRTVLHARTEYEDWPDAELRRHLLRVWIDAPELLPVAPEHELGDIFSPQ